MRSRSLNPNETRIAPTTLSLADKLTSTTFVRDGIRSLSPQSIGTNIDEDISRGELKPLSALLARR
jgi:hypothetical protein